MAVEAYDALVAPDPLAWLETGDEARIDLVIAYHIGIGDVGDNQRAHALLHAIVENQVATGGEMAPVQERLRQLMEQGLDRHDAVHAIAYVVGRHMDWMALGRRGDDPGYPRYFRELKRMSGSKYFAIARAQRGMEAFDAPLAP